MLLLYSKDILLNLDASKVFAKEPFPYEKFDEKHDGDVTKLV